MHAEPLRILFPTNFSDACDRASRALTQLASVCRLDLTIVHVTRPGHRTARLTHELERFLFDGHYFGACRRLMLDADDGPGAVSALCRQDRFDLVMAPASERPAVRRLLTRSFRARLLRQCDVPLWTAGDAVASRDFDHPIRTVACLMDFDTDRVAFVRLVADFARRFHARTVFLYVVPPVDEGMLTHALTSSGPLLPALAVKQIREMFDGHAPPDVDVAVGYRGRELRRMLTHHRADLLFVGPRQAAASSWALRFSRDLDHMPCPVICVDGAAAGFAHWSFEGTPWAPPAREAALAPAGEPMRQPHLDTGWPPAFVRR